MHEVIKSLTGIKVIANDFTAVGFGDTDEQVIKNHDGTSRHFWNIEEYNL